MRRSTMTIVRLPSLLLLLLLGASSPFLFLPAAVAESDSTSSSSNNNDNGNSVSVSIPPVLQTISTDMNNSTSSTSGFMFDLKARGSSSSNSTSDAGGVVLYGLDINLIDDDSTTNAAAGTEVVVYTKSGSFRSYERDESKWTYWFTIFVTSQGMDVPTALLASRGSIIINSSSSSTSTTTLPSPTMITTSTTTAPSSSSSGGGSSSSAAPTATATTSSTTSVTTSNSRVDDGVDNQAAATDDDQVTTDDDAAINRRQIQEATATSDTIGVPPIFLPPNSRLAIYISTPSGPHLRYSSSSNTNNRYYTSESVILDAHGAAKRKGWDGQIVYPRAFSGGLHYYASDAILDGEGELLPSNWEPPTANPTTLEPTYSMVPTMTASPSVSPTLYPTLSPSASPTNRPSWSPVTYSTLSTPFEEEGTKPVLVYAGNMFDIKGRSNIEISSLGIHTYLNETNVTIDLYIRSGSYVGYEDSLDGWELRGGNITVKGNGMGNPTYLPYGSFEPILLKEQEVLGIYITCTDGPYLRSSMGDVEGNPSGANPDMVIYEGIGKRYPIEMGGLSPRVFNGVFEYVVLDVPSPSPTMDLSGGVGSQGEKDMWVANATFAPIADMFIQRSGSGDNGTTTYGRSTQLMVDGLPQKVSLLYFNVSVLNGNKPARRPSQVLKATLRLYSMTSQSMFGGYVDVLTNGGSDVDEDTTTWENCGYGEREAEGFERMGQFRAVWPEKFYEIDVTQAFRGGSSSSSSTSTGENDDVIIIPTSLLVRLSSDQEDGVMYRSREGDSDNGPRLFVTFAYNPDVNLALAREFGSDPPTMAPTVLPVWEDAEPPTTPDRTYFNYDPSGSYGPDYWENMEDDGYYDQFRRLRTDRSWNRCGRGERQSPRDLCATTDKCVEFHQARPRIGEYGLTDENWARPTPLIMHNKLRLQYPERRSEWERPEPPGADFAHNVFQSGIQDILNIDLKVGSEHRLCGKQYDGEMQLFYIHREGNLEALSILIEVDSTEMNGHFQVLLDYFQDKFDEDASLCLRRRTKARALFGRGRNGKSATTLRGMRSSSSSSLREKDPEETIERTVEENEDDASATSLGSFLYQKIHDSFIRRRRETERPPTWNPLEPWYILRSVHFWGYIGSITEPPCFEEVKWRVVDVPMKIHFNQYLQLKRLTFDHVDPDTCLKTSTHFEESNARPVQTNQNGAVYRCRRSDYASDMERRASGRVKGFVLEENWWGVNNLPYITPEFPNA